MKFLASVFLFASLTAHAQTQEQLNRIKNEDYINYIVSHVGNKRIVALGEDTHGTAEFYELRAAITKRLIQEKGFTTLVLENPHEDMLALQEKLFAKPLDTLMRQHLFSIYQTKQVKAFLQWFKTYAAKHTRLKLAGCDDSYREILPAMMIGQIKKMRLPTLLPLALEFEKRQVKGGDSNLEYGLATYNLLRQIDSLYHKQEIRSKPLEELLFHAKTAYVFYERFSRRAAVSRDEMMGERINYYAADSTQKIIVWAHSGHIAKYAWLQQELGLMGATVYKRFPNDYLAISMSSANGNYSYIRNRFINDDHVFNDTLFTAAFRETKYNSWNHLLAANKSEKFVLDLGRIHSADSADFYRSKDIRIQGYRKEGGSYSEFYPVSLPRMFDMILFLRNTTATTALFK